MSCDKFPLEDYLSLITYGFTNPMPDAEDGPWKITAKDIIDGKINYNTARKTEVEAYRELTQKSKPKIGDVLLTKDGTLGRVAIVDRDDICINQSVALLRCNKKISPNYLAYLLQAPEYQAKMIADSDGTTIKHIYITRVNKMLVSVPPIIYQKKAVKILSALDDKIELNNKINKTLEEMAQAIFKSWFVDFEPFTDESFKNIDNNCIPESFIMRSLYDFAEYINGTSFRKDEYSSSGLPIVKIAELKNGITSSTEYFQGSKEQRYYIKNRDMLFSWSGNPETSIDVFIWQHGDAILNQHTFHVVPKDADYCFVYLLLKHFMPEFSHIASNKQTTGLGHVTVADLKRLQFPFSRTAVKNFEIVVTPIIEQIYMNLLENKSLILTRDTLLPKLMSGEIRVPVE